MSDPNASQWSLNEILVPESGRRITHYFYKRKRCKRIQLESPLARQLAGYTLIEKDLRSTLVWLAEIERLHNQFDLADPAGPNHLSPDREVYNVIKGLFVATLSFYGKCFTRCEGRRVKLERSNIGEQYLETHDLYMRFRHSFAAHSGADRFEEVQIALVLPPKKATSLSPRIMRELKQPDLLWSDAEDPSFKELVLSVQRYCLDKIERLSKRILQDDVTPMGREHWYGK